MRGNAGLGIIAHGDVDVSIRSDFRAGGISLDFNGRIARNIDYDIFCVSRHFHLDNRSGIDVDLCFSYDRIDRAISGNACLCIRTDLLDCCAVDNEIDRLCRGFGHVHLVDFGMSTLHGGVSLCRYRRNRSTAE